jgi:hypothetical protein
MTDQTDDGRHRSGDPLTFEERDGLTVWGRYFAAQIRHYGYEEREHLVIHVRDDAPRSAEDGQPVTLPPDDVEKLRALLNESARRTNGQVVAS